MKEIQAEKITETVREMCIEANHFLTPDMKEALADAGASEKSELGRSILSMLEENLKIAGEDMIPICQDSGMAVFFVEIGQEVHIAGGNLTDAVNEGVRRGYTEGYLRKSVVSDPLIRENTKDNTPAVIHYDIVPGDRLRLTIA
ncbi:MAG: fumarate hydratase, partial [Lachnospiraceae bacterium]|nr:fumarate hydratase [Lachnospiraceae bacterium]